MRFSVLLRRLALVAAATGGLVSCVGVDTPEPGAGRRAEPRAGDRLEGRVDGRQLIGRVGAVPYAQASRRSVPAMASPPAEAGAADCPPADADPLGVHDRRCYGADRQAADGMAGDDAQPDIQPVALSDAAAGSRMLIPPEGVNIDAELGVAGAGDNPLGVGEAAPQPAAPVAAQILVPQGPMAIAEGQTSQPVVDGIGTDNPTALPSGAAQPSTLSL